MRKIPSTMMKKYIKKLNHLDFFFSLFIITPFFELRFRYKKHFRLFALLHKARLMFLVYFNLSLIFFNLIALRS